MRAAITLDERHQEEPTTTGKEAKQEETLALALREEEVIDGEVTEVLEPEQQPTPKQRPYYLIVVCTVLACLLFVGVSLLLPLLTPSAIVTIILRQERISTTATIPIHGRVLAALTLSQSTTVPATGKGHQNATRATGAITFYNGLFTSQTIGAGTILTSADGVQIVTNEPAIIPAGNPPVYGQVTVSAHAVLAGVSGNIQAFDIDEACCLTSVLAKNATAFTGGAEARDFLVVTRADIDTAAGAILPILEKSEQAALRAQITPGEALILSSCRKQTMSDHTAGEEATAIHITVSETCEAFAYLVGELHQNATKMITMQAFRRLGTGFRLMGDLQVRIVQTTVTDPAQGIVTIAVKTDATYVYQLSLSERKRITHLIAGKSKEQAILELFQLPGIQGASINSNEQTLPEDPGRITIVVLYRSASL